ncbi:MAG TPA: hypothetical protein VLT81_11015 [Chondromyces sp.]|nr:hypothetical protein [Chondromyces sp.]
MSRQACGPIAIALAALAVAAAGAEAPRDLATLFPQQAPIFVDGGGIARLVLPAEVLGACRADLSDLRVFDREGREVAYLVDSGRAPEQRLEATEALTPELLAVDRRRIDRESGPPLWQERFEIALPAAAPASGSWTLVLETRRPSFVRRVDVAQIGADGSRTGLVDGGSLFRLQAPLRERLEVALPETAAGRLRVTLAGEDGPYLETVLRLESTRLMAGAERASVRLEELGRRRADGRTVVELERPRGLVPDLLVLDAATPAFSRRAEVWDHGAGASDARLGEGLVFRLRTFATVEETSLPVAPAHGDRLLVIVDDGDSPPLEGLVVSAVVRRPALLFALPEGPSGEPAGVLRYGGGRAFRPRYDLAGLAAAFGPGTPGAAAEALIDPQRLAVAHLGPARANPAFDAAPALAFAQRAGAALDRAPFSHRRQLAVAPSPEGLSRLVLLPEDAALLRPDLADLRIVDPDSRQWAYLLEDEAEVETRELPVGERRTEAGVSSYRLELPVVPAVLARLVIEVREPFFDRAFWLEASLDGDQETTTLARGRLVRRIGDPRPLTVELPQTAVHALDLRIEDGDDAALVLGRVSARFPLAAVFFAAPEGAYELLLGHPDAAPPRYELARVRDVVLAVASTEAAAGPLTANPDFEPGFGSARRGALLQAALWAAIAVLVVFLTALTLRLARQER